MMAFEWKAACMSAAADNESAAACYRRNRAVKLGRLRLRLRDSRAPQERRNRSHRIGLLLVTGDKRAPRLRANRGLRFPDHIELPIAANLADHHGLVQMVV